MFRFSIDENELNVLLGKELGGGQVRIPLPALARFARQMDRQLRKLQRQMQRKYPTHPRTTAGNRTTRRE
jgi:hypothetical protein